MLNDYVDLTNDCTDSRYVLEYGFSTSGSTDHLKFDESSFEIEIETKFSKIHLYHFAIEAIMPLTWIIAY